MLDAARFKCKIRQFIVVMQVPSSLPIDRASVKLYTKTACLCRLIECKNCVGEFCLFRKFHFCEKSFGKLA